MHPRSDRFSPANSEAEANRVVNAFHFEMVVLDEYVQFLYIRLITGWDFPSRFGTKNM
jgi:hypothetical protein